MSEQYFSPALQKKILQISASPLTMIEAPAGYGKTTAVRHFAEFFPKDEVRWYTSVESTPGRSAEWFFDQVEELDAAAGKALKDLGFINRSNAAKAASILSAMRISTDRCLVFDNFQFAMPNWQIPILLSLAYRKPDSLRIVLISQNFGRLRAAMENASNVCLITSRDLLLSADDIAAYARQLGTSLDKQQAERISSYTEGWIAAVSLYLKNIQADRTPILFFRDIDSLMFNFFWRKITPEEQEVFLRFSVFDRIEREQIANWDRNRAEEIVSLLKRAPLMRLDEQYGVLYPHEILSSFLNTQLECAAPEIRDEIYRDAGKWYRQAGKMKKAIACFFHIRDYEQIMACDVTGLYNEKFGGLSYTKFAGTVLSECPPETAAKYPVSALRLCMVLFGGADFSSFEKNLERLRALIADSGDRQMMGEWYIVSSFLDFPDTVKMKERYLQAEKLMTRPSRVIDKRDPFMFGSTSMWYLFYTRPGEMMRQAADLREMMAVYNRLTENHGAGAYELYLGEALSVQGLFDESDIYAHRAALRAEQSQNVSVSYGTALLLGINAIYQSDMVALQKAIEYLENKALAYPFLQNTAINQLMTETVRGYLLGLMMEPSQSAKWTQGEADALGDLSFANFMVKTSRVTDLILQKEYKRAIASVEQSLTLDSRLISLSTRNFMYVGLALCYLAVGHPLTAAEWLDKSLTIAEADKNYTFLASFRKYLGALFLLPALKTRHARAIREIRDMKISYTRAEESKIFFMLENQPEQVTGLTDREREVANLVAQGLHNREIAERLCISEETVKSHVRTIFNKMNIDRRSQLVELLK